MRLEPHQTKREEGFGCLIKWADGSSSGAGDRDSARLSRVSSDRQLLTSSIYYLLYIYLSIYLSIITTNEQSNTNTAAPFFQKEELDRLNKGKMMLLRPTPPVQCFWVGDGEYNRYCVHPWSSQWSAMPTLLSMRRLLATLPATCCCPFRFRASFWLRALFLFRQYITNL